MNFNHEIKVHKMTEKFTDETIAKSKGKGFNSEAYKCRSRYLQTMLDIGYVQPIHRNRAKSTISHLRRLEKAIKRIEKGLV